MPSTRPPFYPPPQLPASHPVLGDLAQSCALEPLYHYTDNGWDGELGPGCYLTDARAERWNEVSFVTGKGYGRDTELVRRTVWVAGLDKGNGIAPWIEFYCTPSRALTYTEYIIRHTIPARYFYDEAIPPA